jgi:hypothetical protein
MTLTEYAISYLPLLLMLGLAAVVLQRLGAFQQREHRARVEALLERIAQAVEASAKQQR